MEIAVIVPVHNQVEELRRCLASIKEQATSASIGIYVVDDGSDPPLNRRDNRYQCRSGDQLHFITRHSDFGVQQARNLGWNYAKDQHPTYVLFCDADIEWKPHAFDIFLSTLEANPESAYSYGDYDRYGLFTGLFRARPFSSQRLRIVNFISTMSMIRADCLPEVPFVVDEERLQDWSLWLRMLNDGHEGAYTGRVMFQTGFKLSSVSARGAEHYRHWHRLIQGRYVKS